jgi:hypothetical protein
VSRNLISRRAGVLAAAVAAGVVGMAGPAFADVTVSPSSAPQGSGQNLHLTVTNTGSAAITKVKLVMPADTPVAEVFPLSVDDWAPQIEHRTLDTPLTSTHGGAPVTQTAASITWLAVTGPLPPGKSADLAVALGPLPMTSQMTLTVIPTYADGKVGPAMPPVTLKLTPAQPAAGHGHGNSSSGNSSSGNSSGDSEEAAFAAIAEQAQRGPGFWSIAGWVIAGLALAGAAVLLLRGRHRREDADDEEPEPADEEKKEPVSTGAKITAWSYRDGPE